MAYEYEITKSKVISSLLWKIAERFGTQGIQLLVIILLARLLLPEDFGMIVLVTVFITIGGFIVESGFTEALIQKKDARAIDFSSVFYLNLFTAFILFNIFYFTAPFIADFLHDRQFALVLQVLSISLFFNAINAVQHAVIARNMQFKKLFASSLSAILISGTIGITMASLNFGIWALVVHQLTYRCIVTSVLWFTVKWRPTFSFSISHIRNLFSYGWKLLFSLLLYNLYLHTHNLIIGKLFSNAMLGFYNRGMQFPSIIVENLNGSIQNVLFPTLAAQQDHKEKIKEMLSRLVVLCSFVVFPMMVGLAVIAEPLIRVLLTEKWMPTVPLLQLFCTYYALLAVDGSNLQVIKALGRSDLYLKLEIAKFTIGLLILLTGLQFGIYALALGMVLNEIIGTILGGVVISKLLNYPFWQQWKDVIPNIFLSIVMGFVVYGVRFISLPDLLTLVIQVVIGVLTYGLLALIFKVRSTKELFTILNDRNEKQVPIESISN